MFNHFLYDGNNCYLNSTDYDILELRKWVIKLRKNILITGASDGLGKALVELLHEESINHLWS